jgi:hypothetical protein
MPNKPEEITITIDREQGIYLMESLTWSLGATERSQQRNPNDKALSNKYEALDDIMAQLQAVKRELWYGGKEVK